VRQENIFYEEVGTLKTITIVWVPTVAHCSFANQIALALRTKLTRELLNFDDYKIDIIVKEGAHQSKRDLDKMVNDKERVAAA
jgi:hypothetical protein